MKHYLAPSAITAGFVAVLVGYSSAAVIVFQAAQSLGATQAQTASWMWALGIGMGLLCIGLSLRYKQPIMAAWSTPGAALMTTGQLGMNLSEAVAAFLFSSILIALCGFSGSVERLMAKVPRSLGAAMLAGVLFQFGLDLFISLQQELLLVALMLAAYLLLKPVWPRYVVLIALLLGAGVTFWQGQLAISDLTFAITTPEWVTPQFSWQGVVSLGVPLFVVTMASQNVPGIAVLRAHGYQAPASPLIGWTGIVGAGFAAAGGFAYNLAAITAAICMGDEAHPESNKRYVAAIWAGLFYLAAGVFGVSIVALFIALPQALVMAIAGLALLGTIGTSLSQALVSEPEREAAVVTLLMTASGVSIGGIGSAFWGLLLGMAVLTIGMRVKAKG